MQRQERVCAAGGGRGATHEPVRQIPYVIFPLLAGSACGGRGAVARGGPDGDEAGAYVVRVDGDDAGVSHMMRGLPFGSLGARLTVMKPVCV